MAHKDPKPEKKARKSYTISRNCLILILTPQPCKQWESDTDGAVRSPLLKTGRDLFKDFQRENKHSFWNKPLANSMKDISFLGFFHPYTLFIKGNEKTLETLREAYARRVLKPPRNFSIVQVGDVPGIDIAPIQQAQFIPLTEVLCLIISEMNKRKLTATQNTIRSKLGECYNKMPIPSPEIIHKSLTHLLNEHKIEHSGQGYFIIGVEQLSSSNTSNSDDDSGTEYSCRIKKPPQERAYLMFKDGEITKHTLPTFMIDKGTQTPGARNGIHNVHMATRPMSFPSANPNTNPNGMQTIYEREPTSVGQSPQTTPERTTGTAAMATAPAAAPATAPANNFQRTSFSQSMREKRNSPSKKTIFDRTSSMRVKMDIETGYLTSDSEAKPSCFGKLLGNKSAKKAAFMKATTKQNNMQTFQAQFPPSDVHDPFFNVAHWQEKSPHKLALNGNGNSKERIIEGAGNTAVVKEKKKKDGPLPKDSQSRSTQQYKVDHGKLTNTAQTLQQKYKAAAEESMPESEAEFVRPTNMIEGKFRTKAVADQTRPPQKKKVLSIHSDKIKHYFSTIRDTKPQQVKPFQGISDCETESQYAGEQLRNLPPGLDLPHVHSNSTIAIGAKNHDTSPGQYCALPSESETESISAPSIVRQFVATSRHINETFKARKHGSPGANQVGNSNNTMGASPVRERPLGLSPSQPYPEQHGFNGGVQNGATNKQNGQKHAPLAGGDGDEFYDEDEIDDLIRHEMNHNASPSSPSQAQAQKVFAAYPEFQNQNSRDARLTHSNQNIHCAHKEESSLQRFNQQQHVAEPDRGSRSLPTTPSHENMPGSRVVVHQRLESLCSSTGDSGFNSPRSSLSQGHNNNYDSPNGHNSISEKALKRHSMGSILDNKNANELSKMTKSPSSTSTRSTGSENTVKSQVEKRKHRNGDYPMSPGKSGSRGNLNRPTSFDVIGTL